MKMSKYFGDLAVFHLGKKTGRSGKIHSSHRAAMAEVNADGEGAWDSGERREGPEWVDRARGNPFPALRQLGAAQAWRSGRPWKLL